MCKVCSLGCQEKIERCTIEGLELAIWGEISLAAITPVQHVLDQFLNWVVSGRLKQGWLTPVKCSRRCPFSLITNFSQIRKTDFFDFPKIFCTMVPNGTFTYTPLHGTRMYTILHYNVLHFIVFQYATLQVVVYNIITTTTHNGLEGWQERKQKH